MEHWLTPTVECDENIVLAESLRNPFGVVLVPAGTPLTPELKRTLAVMGIDSILVYAKDSEANSGRRSSA